MNFIKDLFQIIETNDYIFKLQFANSTHFVFKSHFPTNHILPGFLQIDIAQILYKKKFKKIKKVKFINIIKPEDIIEYRHDPIKNKIIIFKQTNKITEIDYE